MSGLLPAPDNAIAAAGAAAATGNNLPALQPPLPQELIAALGSMPPMLGPPGAAALPGADAAAAAIAGILPGSWPLHLLGLLRPPSLPAPNVMQLALMMQAAAQAAVLPGGGGLQQTAMLVAAVQSMASSSMQGMFGPPWGVPGLPGIPPWQQQPQQQLAQQQQVAHNTQNTQNNGSCLGQYGQGHLMSQGTQGVAGQHTGKAALQPGSHLQAGSHLCGSHYIGSHHQTSTTGEYSGQAGDCTHSQPLAGGTHQHQWLLYPEHQQRPQQQQQQHWSEQDHHQQQWHAAHQAAAAELAAVEAITPRHSHKPQHKATGYKRGGRVGESRRNRANNRLRVKGRFVKKGTPGECRFQCCGACVCANNGCACLPACLHACMQSPFTHRCGWHQYVVPECFLVL